MGLPARAATGEDRELMNHLEMTGESPIWRHVFAGWRKNTLIRYDARGNGMSDWDVNEPRLTPG
jgi:hypothetical protein